MKMFKVRTVVVSFLLSMFPLCNNVSCQSMKHTGLAGSVELGSLVQKYPYLAVSGSLGMNNGSGLFLGGGVLFETPVAKDPKFDASPAPSPGPFERDRMLGVFAEARYAIIDSAIKPFLDLKAGPAYNLDSKSFQNLFARPTAGICLGPVSLSAGIEIGCGQYADERYREPVSMHLDADLVTGSYWSYLPYVSVAVCF